MKILRFDDDRISVLGHEKVFDISDLPWHRDFPQRPKTWTRKDNGTGIWGIRSTY
jgi:hypothetical protein